jgi:hypothetical protein
MLMMVGVPTACQVNAVGRRSEAARHVIPGAAISGRPADVRVTLEAATGFTGWFRYHHSIFLQLMLEKNHNLVSIREYIAQLLTRSTLYFHVHQLRYMNLNLLFGLPDKSYALFCV